MDFPPARGGLRPSQNPILRKVSWKALFLLLFVAVFLVVVFFLFEQQTNTSKKKQPLFDASKITFANSTLGQNFENNLKQAYASKDEGEKVQKFISAFAQLSTDYKIKPSEDKWKLLTQIYSYLKTNYPSDVDKSGLAVPCLEAYCGVVINENFISLEKHIGDNKLLDEELKQSLLYDLRIAGAAFSQQNKTLAFNNSISVFNKLKAFWVTNPEDELKSLLAEALDLIKKVDLDTFEKYKEEKGLKI